MTIYYWVTYCTIGNYQWPHSILVKHIYYTSSCSWSTRGRFLLSWAGCQIDHILQHCITLHHTASHCITLHHTASHCMTSRHTIRSHRREYHPGGRIWRSAQCQLTRLRPEPVKEYSTTSKERTPYGTLWQSMALYGSLWHSFWCDRLHDRLYGTLWHSMQKTASVPKMIVWVGLYEGSMSGMYNFKRASVPSMIVCVSCLSHKDQAQRNCFV